MSAAQKRFMSFIGTTKVSEITRPGWRQQVVTFAENVEKENPQVVAAEIKGSEAHKSRDDPSDPEEVISLRLYDANGKRVASAHVHQDGTGKVKWW